MIITNALLNFLYGIVWVVTLPLRLLPDATLPAEITNAITQINGYLSSMDFIIPIDTILTILGFVITTEVAILLYKGINWLIRKIPFVN